MAQEFLEAAVALSPNCLRLFDLLYIVFIGSTAGQV